MTLPTPFPPALKRASLLFVFAAIAVTGIFLHKAQWQPVDKVDTQDVYYIYLEGYRIIHHENPYERVLGGNMRNNEKYATYFPLFYVIGGASQLAGLRNFPEWLAFWRIVFLACVVGIAYFIFHACQARNEPLLGLFGATFWLFNRWTLEVTSISHIDFLPLLLLLVSLYLLPRRFSLGCILFGVSLALKQIAIFALPLYLVWGWQVDRKDRNRHLVKALILVSIVPVVISLPFLAWNAEGYLKSVLFGIVSTSPPLFLHTTHYCRFYLL